MLLGHHRLWGSWERDALDKEWRAIAFEEVLALDVDCIVGCDGCHDESYEGAWDLPLDVAGTARGTGSVEEAEAQQQWLRTFRARGTALCVKSLLFTPHRI